MKINKITINAMFVAMVAVLGYISMDFGNIKITIEGIPIIIAALLFGPFDGLLVGSVGTIIYQFLKYGFSITTPLWVLPHAFSGWFVGFFAQKYKVDYSRKSLKCVIIADVILITLLNTIVLIIDSRFYGYYSAAFILSALPSRLLICSVKSVIYSLLIPKLASLLSRATN